MCASFSGAMKAGQPVYVEAQPSLADGLAVPKVSTQASLVEGELSSCALAGGGQCICYSSWLCGRGVCGG